jgi:membrane fusion protein (multidrug efflux system)
MSQAATQADLTAPSRVAVQDRPRTGSVTRLVRPVLMIGGIVVVIAGAAYWWLQGGRYVSIDDAYIRAAKVSVATDVSGIVSQVAVHEGQEVHKGDLLLKLDPRPFQFALDGAKANLAQTVLNVDAMKSDYQRMLRDTGAREAQVQSDQATADRLAALVKGGGVTKQEYDDARYKLIGDQRAVESLQAQAQAQLAKLAGNPTIDAKDTPDYKAAAARVDEAQRQLNDSEIHAPFAGVVTEVDAAQPGQYLTASTAAFGLVSTENVWAEGYPKETEITWAKPGDPVTVTVDTYPGRTWKGTLDSISPASGSEFSLIPAQNASGNWVKVVQRIPVRVRIDKQEDGPDLRSGMSVEISIDTGHLRHVSDLY